MLARFLTRAWRRLRVDERGVAAIEFALVVPAVILIYVVGFEVTQAATANRKLTDTTVQLANVTAQYTTMTCSTDIPNVLNASAQIMTPYPTGNLSIVLSEVSVDSSNHAYVDWYQPWSNGALTTGIAPTITMPAGYQNQAATSSGCPIPAGAPNAIYTCYISVQTTYTYQPSIGAAFIGPITMTNQMFMLPRASSSVPISDLSSGAITCT